MRRAEIEQQRNELIKRVRQVRAVNPRANPLYRKALGLLTRTWIRTPAIRHLGLLKTAMWLIDIADKYPVI
jgi:hypothetical protein